MKDRKELILMIMYDKIPDKLLFLREIYFL
jgi:hypothetical protein